MLSRCFGSRARRAIFRSIKQSATCAGGAGFYFDSETKHGIVDDPDMLGVIKVLDAEKTQEGYTLKVKFVREEE